MSTRKRLGRISTNSTHATRKAGKRLVERLAIYPGYARDAQKWVDADLRKPLFDLVDADGWPRADGWRVGRADPLPARDAGAHGRGRRAASRTMSAGRSTRRRDGASLERSRDRAALPRARRRIHGGLRAPPTHLRREVNGDVVSYVVTRNINYTNICSFKCQFCAFSKGKLSENLRGRPYDLETAEIACAGARSLASRRDAKSACRAASIPRTPARNISRFAAS